MNLERPFCSSNGRNWIMTAGTATTYGRNMVLIGSDESTTSLILPSAITPWSANVSSFFRDCGINDSGQWVVCGKDNSGSATDTFILRDIGAGMEPYAREGSLAFSTGFRFGTTLDNVSIDRNGQISFYSRLLDTPVGIYDDEALWYADEIIAREGVTIPPGQAYGEETTLNSTANVSFSRYYRSEDGSTWIGNSNLYRDPQVSPPVPVVLVNGAVKYQEGYTVLNPPYVDPVGKGASGHLGVSNVAPNGDWYVRANNGTYSLSNINQALDFWVQKNDMFIAQENQPVTPCADEVWMRRTSTSFVHFLSFGNSRGDYIVGGSTNAPPADETRSGVLVLNGRKIVMRSNDPVDLDGNGVADDNIYIRNFFADFAFLTPDLKLFIVVNLKNTTDPTTSGIGRALIVKQLTNACLADFDQSDSVEVTDIFAFLNAWFSQFPTTAPCLSADADGNGTVEVADIFRFLNEWFALFGSSCQ